MCVTFMAQMKEKKHTQYVCTCSTQYVPIYNYIYTVKLRLIEVQGTIDKSSIHRDFDS